MTRTPSSIVFFLFLLFQTAAACAEDASSYPQTHIVNKELDVLIYLPDAEKGYYRGTRFDWSGLIQQAKYKGHTFFGDWKTTHDPGNHDDVNGTASEFGMESPLGFADAAKGESFVKIGIGELQKPDNQAYQFYRNYKIVKPFSWTVTQGDGWIEFHQAIDEFKGWKYDYVKRIELAPDQPVFTIAHKLKNTGSKTIDTDHYCHHFTIIDGDPIGVHYRLQFFFDVKARRSLNGIAKAENRQIVFLKNLTSGSIFTELDGVEAETEHNQAIIENMAAGAAIHIQGNRPPKKINFWATTLAVCPEPFVAVKIAPGETFEWENRYSLSVQSAVDSKKY